MKSNAFAEKVHNIPQGETSRKWTLRADNARHYHCMVSLKESPLFLVLNWRETAVDSVRLVGIFRLDLDRLLRDGYIRHDPVDSRGSDVRLRIVRNNDGSFYVQSRPDGPRYFLSRAD